MKKRDDITSDFLLNKSEISSLYVSLFGRASEGAGNLYWRTLSHKENLSMFEIANKMLQTDAAKNFFGDSMNSNSAFINHIYATTLNKGVGIDTEGKEHWTKLLDQGMQRGVVVTELLRAALHPKHAESKDPATKEAHILIANKIKASNAVADTIWDYKSTDPKNIKKDLDAFIKINESMKGDGFDDAYIKDVITKEAQNLSLKKEMLDNSLGESSHRDVMYDLTGVWMKPDFMDYSKEFKKINPGAVETENKKDYLLNQDEMTAGLSFFEKNWINIKSIKAKDGEVLKFSTKHFKEYPNAMKLILKENKIVLVDVSKDDKKTALEENIVKVELKPNELLEVSAWEARKLIEKEKVSDGKLSIKEPIIRADLDLIENPKVGYFELKEDIVLEKTTKEITPFLNKTTKKPFIIIKDALSNIKSSLSKIGEISDMVKSIERVDMQGDGNLVLDSAFFKKLGDKFSTNIKYDVKHPQGELKAKDNAETFYLDGKNVNSFKISGFDVSKDKIVFEDDLKKGKIEKLTLKNNKNVEDNTLYIVNSDNDDAFSLFGETSNYLNKNIRSDVKSAIALITDKKVNVYAITPNENPEFESEDIALLGVIEYSGGTLNLDTITM